MAKEKDKTPSIVIVEKFLSDNYDFVYNVVTDSIDYRRKGTDKFEPVNEHILHREIQHLGVYFPLSNINSLLQSDFVTRYCPLKSYLEGLTPYDGSTDYIELMAKHVDTEDNPFWYIMFLKMLVRMIAGVLVLIPNRIVIVLVGGQECGKSWFLRNLNPFPDGQYYTEDPLCDDKDSIIRCSENMLYNLEELGVLSGFDLQKLKARISSGPTKQRRAYERRERSLPRRCTFVGSTNKDFFLTDDSNTRWVCIRVKGIDWGYKQAVDIHKMWAQAYHLYKTGFDYNLTEAEKKIRDATNREYEVAYCERDYVLKYYTPAAKNEQGAEFMSVTQIRDDLQEREELNKELSLHNLGKALKEFNFVKDRRYVDNVRVQGYWFNRRKSDPKYTDEPNHTTNEAISADASTQPTINDNGEIDYDALFHLLKP